MTTDDNHPTSPPPDPVPDAPNGFSKRFYARADAFFFSVGMLWFFAAVSDLLPTPVHWMFPAGVVVVSRIGIERGAELMKNLFGKNITGGQ